MSVTVVVSMVSLTCVTAGVGSVVTTTLPPPVVPVMVAEIDEASRYGVSLPAKVTFSAPEV
ncbi:hypothetical protein [Pseudomonas sp. 25 E 4]|nr:hypothetical protein [Pseudomonas sp. 25 E 4]